MDEVVATYPKTRLRSSSKIEYAQEERRVARAPSTRDIPLYADASVMAEPGRGLVLILQGQSLTGASFTSVEQLKKHIDAFIKSYNEDAKPFVWTKSSRPAPRQGRRLSDL